MTSCDNLNFPPVYQRLRDRAFAFFPIAVVCYFARSGVDLATRGDGVQDGVWKTVAAIAFAAGTLPSAYYLVRMGVLKLRAIYARSPLCPLCAAKMIAPHPAAASSADSATPADPPATLFTCPRCHHATTAAEVKAAWRDVT